MRKRAQTFSLYCKSRIAHFPCGGIRSCGTFIILFRASLDMEKPLFIATILIALLILLSGCASFPKACTMEAKLCPDGSAVGRNGSDNCEFGQCPPAINCSNCAAGNCPASCAASPICTSYTAENCPPSCVVCPPCAECSSISCQTEEYCSSIGFNRSWWESVQPK